MKKIQSVLFLVVAVSFVVSCSGDEEVTLDESEVALDESDSTLNINADADLLLRLVNDYRKDGVKCGNADKNPQPLLIWDDELAKAALAHSNDMHQNNDLTHKGSDGSRFSDRIKRTDFTGSAVGENVAYNFFSEESVMVAWIGSTGHCKNIMRGQATHIGIARSDEGSYWTMLFGRID